MNNKQRKEIIAKRCDQLRTIDKIHFLAYHIYGRIYHMRVKLWQMCPDSEEKWEGFENFKMEV